MPPPGHWEGNFLDPSGTHVRPSTACTHSVSSLGLRFPIRPTVSSPSSLRLSATVLRTRLSPDLAFLASIQGTHSNCFASGALRLPSSSAPSFLVVRSRDSRLFSATHIELDLRSWVRWKAVRPSRGIQAQHPLSGSRVCACVCIAWRGTSASNRTRGDKGVWARLLPWQRLRSTLRPWKEGIQGTCVTRAEGGPGTAFTASSAENLSRHLPELRSKGLLLIFKGLFTE